MIAKPSEVTPMTAYIFSKLCIEVGIPNGVINILHGSGLSIGDPLKDSTQFGALVSKSHLEKVYSYVELAKAEGGTILTGGNKPVIQEEIFVLSTSVKC